MAVISPTSHDTIVVGLSMLMTFTVFLTMRQMLIHYRDSAVVPPSENIPQYITQEVEDSLKLSTLEKLLESPSWSVRDTTSVIIYERALHNENSFTTILRCISRPDYDTREKGIRALNLMINSMTVGFLHSPHGYVALIKCLKFCVTDYEHNAFEPGWDNWPFRDIVEQITLSLLIKLVEKFGPRRLLQYRFIEDWLVKEPWGSAIYERQLNFARFLQENNHKLNDIVSPIFQDSAGLKQLQKAKLIRYEFTDQNESENSQEQRLPGQDSIGVFVVELGRRRLQSSADEYVRRRHREAMVLNDGSRPLGREDIIQRER